MLNTELERFIEEEIGADDTSCTIVPVTWIHALIITNENGVLAGLEEANQICNYFGLEYNSIFKDSDHIQSGNIILEVWGPARDILRAERLTLNFLCKMSGIATISAKCAELANGIRVACTRKTTPGFRKFEKKAVRLGGGDSHRYNLSDTVMVKDNHLTIMGIEKAVEAAKMKASFTKKIEVEVSNVEEMLTAAKLGVDIIMFDNMRPDEIRKSISTLNNAGLHDDIILEASGGIALDNIREYADTGVDVISLGLLIHSARWLDMNMKIE